jgi:hypothetical protein
MPRPSRPTFQKRLKEKARMEKQREKMQKRLEARDRKAQEAELRANLDIDPDIAGFMPDEEEEKKEKEEEASEEQPVEGS